MNFEVAEDVGPTEVFSEVRGIGGSAALEAEGVGFGFETGQETQGHLDVGEGCLVPASWRLAWVLAQLHEIANMAQTSLQSR